MRIVDKIDFKPVLENPKWIAGYSDITVFHNHLVHSLCKNPLADLFRNNTGNCSHRTDSGLKAGCQHLSDNFRCLLIHGQRNKSIKKERMLSDILLNICSNC